MNKIGKSSVNHGIEVIRAFKKAGVINSMYAPYSMIVGMQPFFTGTDGETRENFFEATRFNDSLENSDDVNDLLEIANKTTLSENYYGNLLLLMSDKYKQDKSFKAFLDENTFQNRFQLQTVDFSGDKTVVDELIRSYVKNVTKGLITDDRRDWEGFKANNQLAIINVAAFDGKFKKKFNKNFTSRDIFYNNGVSKTNVLFMHNVDIFNYTKIGIYSAIEFEYERGLSFVVILSNKTNGLPQLLKDFNYRFLVKLLKSMRPVKVNVSLPSYETTGQNNIDHFLTSELITKCVAQGSDYSGFSKSPGLVLTDILSLSYFKLYEEGTIAGSTLLKGRSLAERIYEFKADHPFLFLIMSPKTKTVFFIGVADETD
ncbi:serpin B3-like protein [Leptotrombidium deliense]|uniref:Serpin B3-like protein n=1 Tax=Leptotrombidium deliense TaxID=299467 RepID=A0A443S9A3_9ACAR|nr:serpin B3-like protein [Leptotrombidium deliense]